MIIKKDIQTYHKKYSKSKLSKTKYTKFHKSKLHNDKLHKSKNEQNAIFLKNEQIELLLLFSTLINYFILLRKTNASRHIYKHKIIELLKDLRNNNKYIPTNTTDKQINTLYKAIYFIFTNIIIELENILRYMKERM